MEPADVDETPQAGESPRECAERLAREKALAVAKTRPRDYVLGADTVVAVDDIILGKPVDTDDAARMLRLLSGRTHRVITGVCLVSPAAGGKESATHSASKDSGERASHENRPLRVASETTLVTMVSLSYDEIREYIASGEPMDKAGAYAIQGIAARWIPRIDGDYSNVVGLPVKLVCELLHEQNEV